MHLFVLLHCSEHESVRCYLKISYLKILEIIFIFMYLERMRRTTTTSYPTAAVSAAAKEEDKQAGRIVKKRRKAGRREKRSERLTPVDTGKPPVLRVTSLS